MGRKSLIFSLFLLLVLGFVLGFFVSSFFAISVKAPPEAPGVTLPPGTPVNGWCCIKAGDECAESVETRVCLQAGGHLFARDQAKCNKACDLLTTLK